MSTMKNDGKHYQDKEFWILVTRRKTTITTKNGEDVQVSAKTNSIVHQKITDNRNIPLQEW